MERIRTWALTAAIAALLTLSVGNVAWADPDDGGNPQPSITTYSTITAPSRTTAPTTTWTSSATISALDPDDGGNPGP